MRTVLLTASLALVAMAGAQGSFQFERKYVQGAKDTYTYRLSIETGQGSVDVTMTQSSTVTKVYDNGDADIEEEVVGMRFFFNGQETPVPAAQWNTKTTTRYSKFGQPVASSSAGPGGRGPAQSLSFMRYTQLFSEKPIAVGETIPVEYKDSKDQRVVVKGTVKLDKVENGVATLVANLEITTTGSATPMKLSGTTLVETATSKLVKSSGTISNLPQQGGLGARAIQYTIERQAG